MEKEVSLRNKYLYKVLIILLKYIPFIIVLCYMVNTFSAIFGVDLPVISSIAGVSLLTWVFLYVSAWVFRFCIYHRMFLYYILGTDIINIIDYYIGIPVSDYEFIMIHSIILGLILFSVLYFYAKNHKTVTS